MTLIPWLALAGSWVTTTGELWKLFERIDKVASPEAKGAVSSWLRNLDVSEAFASWPATFAAAFDSVFGKKHFTLRCFYRSCIASLVAVIIVTLVWCALRPNQFIMYLQSKGGYVFPNILLLGHT